MEQLIKKSKAPIALGIVSLFTWIIPIIEAITSIVGIVLSAKNMKNDKCKTYKIALALNIIGLIITIVYFLFGFYTIMNHFQ